MYSAGAVMELIVTGSPFAIGGFIVSVVVVALQCKSLWLLSHVSNKIPEAVYTKPAFTNLNSTPTVAFVVGISLAMATVFHSHPSPIKRMLFLSHLCAPKIRTAWVTVARWAAQFHAALRLRRRKQKNPQSAFNERGLIKSSLSCFAGLKLITSLGIRLQSTLGLSQNHCLFTVTESLLPYFILLFPFCFFNSRPCMCYVYLAGTDYRKV